MWNSLVDYVVMSDTISTFKNRLDAHWKHRDFLFPYRATYTGTEDQRLEFMLSIRKLMNAVKDVDLEAMPSSIFVNDDDDDDDISEQR